MKTWQQIKQERFSETEIREIQAAAFADLQELRARSSVGKSAAVEDEEVAGVETGAHSRRIIQETQQ